VNCNVGCYWQIAVALFTSPTSWHGDHYWIDAVSKKSQLCHAIANIHKPILKIYRKKVIENVRSQKILFISPPHLTSAFALLGKRGSLEIIFLLKHCIFPLPSAEIFP